jgi:hypothetical protein
LAAALTAHAGAAVIPELDASDAPPIAESAEWFVDAHAAQWRRACELAVRAPLVILDGDPFKGLWFNWVFTDHGWPGVEAQTVRHREHLEDGTLAFPDLYVLLLATEEQLRERRAGDRTRTRRNHHMHLRLIDPQRRYFEELQAVDPARVQMVDTTSRDALVPSILAAVHALPAGAREPVGLFEHLARWVRTQGRA